MFGPAQKRRADMGKKKIADSIIIRVGGGIREVRREPLETEVADLSLGKEDFAHAEDIHPFGSESDSKAGKVPDKIIN